MYSGPIPDVHGNAATYMDQYKNRYPYKTPPAIDPAFLAAAAEQTFRNTGKFVPTELALTQAQFETDFGTRGVNAYNNPFNVGVYDNRTVYNPMSQMQGVQRYYDLIANDYMTNGRGLPDLLNSFVNFAGNRYASDSNYEKKLRGQIPVTIERMKKKKKKNGY